jgi:DNA modification methylase
MMAYLLMMAPRLLELHKKLKGTGSLYLHCDPAASHYLKIVLDVVFGPQSLRNEIIWKRTAAKGLMSKRLARNHDVLLNYVKGPDATWCADAIFTSYDESDLDDKTDEKYALRDADGRRYQLTSLINPNADRPNLTYEFLGVTRVWRWTRERMEEALKNGQIVQPRPGAVPRLKRYLDEQRGKPLGDVWTDIPPINARAKERRHYPTQKPLALLERIIAASSKEGDVVMDPFCGCGTALVAAERMNRKWIGIDVTYLAINEVIHRLRTECAEGRPLNYKLLGSPKDALAAEKLFQSTAAQNHKPFEQWAVTLVGGEYRDRGGPDRGVDGVIPIWGLDGRLHKIVIQVKGGDALTLSAVRDFASVIKDNSALLGLMISMKKPTREMQLVAENQGYAEWQSERKFPKLQIRTVKDLLEDPREPFEIPDHARVPKQEGVGKLQADGQRKLFEE